jgi:hypothetical protein
LAEERNLTADEHGLEEIAKIAEIAKIGKAAQAGSTKDL